MRKTITACLLGLVLVAGHDPAAAQGIDERLQVHGYLTQGFARSDTLEMLGVNDATTADYRSAALQFRYAISGHDDVMLQFSHRRLGESAITRDAASVELDWAFYQRELGPLYARVGRIPVPLGIYNETRDVGTLLPFFRAPAGVYQEGFENIDGASLRSDVALGRFSAELSAFVGGAEYDDVVVTPQGSTTRRLGIDEVIGGQLWIFTPLPGVRLGFNGIRFDVDMGAPEKLPTTMTTTSLDATLDRVLARAEYNVLDLEDFSHVTSWYAQASVRTIRQLWLGAQAEVVDSDAETPMGTMSQETLRDYALGARWIVSPQLVLKGELHQRKGYDFDSWVDPVGAGAEAVYGILSVSVAF